MRGCVIGVTMQRCDALHRGDVRRCGPSCICLCACVLVCHSARLSSGEEPKKADLRPCCTVLVGEKTISSLFLFLFFYSVLFTPAWLHVGVMEGREKA